MSKSIYSHAFLTEIERNFTVSIPRILPHDAFVSLCRWDQKQTRHKRKALLLSARRERLFRTVIVPTVRILQFLALAAVVASIVMVFSSARLFLFSRMHG